MKKLLGILAVLALLCLAGTALAIGPVTFDPPGEVWTGDEPTLTFHCPGAQQIGFRLAYDGDGSNVYILLDESGNGTEQVFGYDTASEATITEIEVKDPDGNWIDRDETFSYMVKSNGPMPELGSGVPEQINPGDALTFTLSDFPDEYYSISLDGRDSGRVFESWNYGMTPQPGGTVTIPGECTASEDVYTLRITAAKKRYDLTSTEYTVIAGDPVREYIQVYYSLTESTGMLKLLESYGIVTLKDPSAALITEEDVTDKPRALKLNGQTDFLERLNMMLTVGEKGYDYLVLKQEDADALSAQLANWGFPGISKILPGKGGSLWSMYTMTAKTLKEFCDGLGIPVPAVGDDPTDEPGAEPTTTTVGALKYSLKGGNATVTGPKSKSAKKLTIPATIKVKGKTYKVTEIKANAFKGMKKLTTVVIGKNVKTIGKNAFYKCAKLKTITIKTAKLTAKTVGASAFKGVYKKATVKVPAKKLKAYKTLLVKKGLPKTAKVKK